MSKFRSLSNYIVLSIFVLAISLFNCSTAQAILLGDSGWDMIVHSYSQDDVLPVTDNVGDDFVLIELFKEFQGSIEYGASLSHIVEYKKIAADAVSQIIITDETIENLTDSEWFDFHMAIISFDSVAGFDPQHVPSGDQLEQVTYSYPLPGYDGLATQIDFVNTIGNGIAIGDVFWPGRQDGEIIIITNPLMQVGDSFLLKEWAPVPEPATIVLFGLSSFPLLKKRCKI